jgi:hypothetical protein
MMMCFFVDGRNFGHMARDGRMLQPIMAHRGTADERPGRTISECRPGMKEPVPRSRWKVCRKKRRECAKLNVGTWLGDLNY